MLCFPVILAFVLNCATIKLLYFCKFSLKNDIISVNIILFVNYENKLTEKFIYQLGIHYFLSAMSYLYILQGLDIFGSLKNQIILGGIIMLKKHMQSKGTKEKSISTKISISILCILIPSLVILIVVSCLMASSSIKTLNDNIIDLQSKYAVSIVDDFFGSKVTAASMFENDAELEKYFKEIKSPQDIQTYPDKATIVSSLSSALNKMSNENIQETWVVDPESDSFLLSNGDVLEAGLANLEWYKRIQTEKTTIISEPYIDPVTKQSIISIVAPVFSSDKNTIVGFMGFDVFIENLSQSLSEIKVGENGYIEILSNDSDYIYSEDPTAIGKNVSELDIGNDYKNNVQNKYIGIMNFSYAGIKYTSMSRTCNTTGWLAIATIPVSEVNTTRNQLITTLIIVSIIILIVMILMTLAIIRKTIKPISIINANMQEFSEGNLSVNVSVHSDDEIGRLADGIRNTIHTLGEIITDIAHILTEISKGNLDVTVKGNYTGDFQEIREALERIIQSLNSTLGQINVASEQVSGGSEQVSSGAQALSQGATEQASSVEELAATINEISGHIGQTAKNAAKASEEAGNVGNKALESNQRMKDMLCAMQEISESSNEIGKIIKTIEDIAFQTNILALNAAVEAARAGVAGKGFAVVADEVRNLASKSANASKSTAALIEGSLKAVENGTKIADETAQAMESVVVGVQKVSDTINSISKASDEQAHSIGQITLGIDQISSVVQNNSATAEESAAASEELSGQAQLLKDLISKFNFKH